VVTAPGILGCDSDLVLPLVWVESLGYATEMKHFGRSGFLGAQTRIRTALMDTPLRPTCSTGRSASRRSSVSRKHEGCCRVLPFHKRSSELSCSATLLSQGGRNSVRPRARADVHRRHRAPAAATVVVDGPEQVGGAPDVVERELEEQLPRVADPRADGGARSEQLSSSERAAGAALSQWYALLRRAGR
jgi:hypothetical protein